MGKLRQLWQDDQGAVLATEYLFLVTILILGLVVGLSNLRTAINAELTELGNAILALNLSFSFSGLTGCCSSVAGSQAIDIPGTLLVPPICTPPTIPVVIEVPLPCV
jgi:Flp pilus assembly pilin Flp